MVRKLASRVAVALAVVLGIGATSALTGDYPSRTVTFVIPFSPGSITDTVARWIAHDLSQSLEQTFIVENKPGAEGMVAGSFVAHARPDGYTLFFTTNTTQAAAPGLFKKVPYDPIKDFVPIARLAGFPSFVAVNPNSPIKSIGELVAYAKANPGKLSAGYGNSSGHVSLGTFKNRLALDIASVPYRGNPAAINDLIAGHTFIAVPDFVTGMPQVRAGKIRPLAVLTSERNSALPDIPTLSETVMPGFDLLAWAGVFAPAGTPAEVVDVLAKALEKSVKKPEFKNQFSQLGIDVFWAGPQEFDKYVKAELVKWTGMIKEAGIEPE